MNEQEVLQKNLAQFLIKDVFNTITDEDILKIRGVNVWEHKGRLLTEGQVKALKNEAGSFRESGLWKILKAELIYLAHDTGYRKSKTEADQIAGKLLEYLTDVIDTKLRKLSE